MKAKNDIERFRYFADKYVYNPYTGDFIHRRTTSNKKMKAGDVVTRTSYGYRQLSGNFEGANVSMRGNRLAYFIMTGSMPNGVVDHINNDRGDDRWRNLQDVTTRVNSAKDKKGKTSRFTGVSWCKTYQKWVAFIHQEGKSINLGSYDAEEDAATAYITRISEIKESKHGHNGHNFTADN